MQTLTAKELLLVWEQGQSLHPVYRALTLLSYLYPELSREELFSLTIGERDLLLLDLHERAFGAMIAGYAECPACSEPLEFSLNTGELRAERSDELGDRLEIPEESISLRFRLPNSYDLAAILDVEDTEEASSLLVRNCVLELTRKGRAIQTDKLSKSTLEKISERMAERDPQAEILLDLSCPACGHEWKSLFDILTFVWKEIDSRAKRLINEVHSLAVSYHWSEAEILELSPQRRRMYLELIGQ